MRERIRRIKHYLTLENFATCGTLILSGIVIILVIIYLGVWVYICVPNATTPVAEAPAICVMRR